MRQMAIRVILRAPVIRLLRRLGRFAISMVATVAFLAGGGIVLLVMSRVTDAYPESLDVWLHVFPHAAFVVACGCSVGVFLLFDRYGLLPDDSEPPTTLGLGPVRRSK